MRHKRVSLLSLPLFALLVGGLLFFAGFAPNQTARAAPAAPVVDTLDDEDDGVCTSGDCSLREAIAAAAPGDTITFAVNGTIVLSPGLGELVIAKNLTIDGGGNISVSGNNAVRVFNVTAGNVTFDDLTIEKGKFTGAVLTCGIASDKGGGGILNDGANVTVKDSTLSDNTADCGGAILNDGTLTVEKSTFSNNEADKGSGGAIDNRSGKTATITDSTFTQNRADPNNGGAINNGGTVNVTRSTLSGNLATTWGGGIYNQGAVNVNNSTFSDNLALEGGGLLSYCNGGNVAVNHSTFTANRAKSVVTRNRGTLGAAESRLDTSIRNLRVARENFLGAESRIRDVDVAEEAAELTRLTILQQAGTAILAQANQQPQLALTLIGG